MRHPLKGDGQPARTTLQRAPPGIHGARTSGHDGRRIDRRVARPGCAAGTQSSGAMADHPDAMLVMPDGAGSAQRIVVVEDDEGAALLERILSAAGYDEIRTASSSAVLDVLLDRWEPDLVL